MNKLLMRFRRAVVKARARKRESLVYFEDWHKEIGRCKACKEKMYDTV